MCVSVTGPIYKHIFEILHHSPVVTSTLFIRTLQRDQFTTSTSQCQMNFPDIINTKLGSTYKLPHKRGPIKTKQKAILDRMLYIRSLWGINFSYKLYFLFLQRTYSELEVWSSPRREGSWLVARKCWTLSHTLEELETQPHRLCDEPTSSSSRSVGVRGITHAQKLHPPPARARTSYTARSIPA